MGKRGPAPDGKISVVDFKTRKDPCPPSGMTKRARNLFKKIVAGNKSNAFDVESVALLRVFCEADNQHYLATNALKKYGAVFLSGKEDNPFYRKNPWFDIQKEAGATMNSVSTKLRNKGVISPLKPIEGNKRGDLLFKKK